MDLLLTRRRQWFRWSNVKVFRSGSDYANRAGFLPKSAYFCWIWPDFEEILADLNKIRLNLKRSWQISTRSSPILKRFGEISTRSCRISTDRTRSYRRTTSIGGESYFRCVFRSGRLKSVFHSLTRQPTCRSRILGSGIHLWPSPMSGQSVLRPDRPGWVGGSGTRSGWTPLIGRDTKR